LISHNMLLHHINIKSAYFLVGALVVYVGGVMLGVFTFPVLPVLLSSSRSCSSYFFFCAS